MLTDCSKYVEGLFLNAKLSFKRTIDFSTITENDILQQLESLDHKSSAGYFGIETCVFKECRFELCKVLALLFNRCLNDSSIPEEWKTSFITPVFKKGAKSNLDNYRPISVVSPISKVFESIIGKQLRSSLEDEGILNPSQFGFRENRSCELALNTMVDDWRLSLDNRKNVLSLFLDLSKAFDTVDHNLLVQVLQLFIKVNQSY